MEPKGTRKEKLLDGLVDEALFRGAAILSEDGTVQSTRGESAALKAAGPTSSGGDSENREDVYVVSIDDDYLVVVFPSHVEFEPVESAVAQWIERLDLD